MQRRHYRHRPQIKPNKLQSLSRSRGAVVWLSGLLWLIVLGGCSPAAEGIFEDYHSRLTRLLPLPAPAINPIATLPALPAVREVLQQLPDLRLDLLDLVAIRHCGLQQLVASRNSSLGKVMTAANQLGYELALLQQLSPCLQHPELSPQLQQQLQQMYQQKQQALPLALSNLLLTDATLRQQLQGSQRSLSPGAASLSSDTLQALQQLQILQQQVITQSGAGATVASTTHPIEPPATTSWHTERINQALALLYQGQLLADLQYSVRYSNHQLQALNQQLMAVDLHQWCGKARHNGQVDILLTVFRQIYLGRVQPYLAELDSINHQLMPTLTALYQYSPFQQVISARFNQPAAELRHQLKTHVRWWQQLQQQCQLDLTTPPAQ